MLPPLRFLQIDSAAQFHFRLQQADDFSKQTPPAAPYTALRR
jgi:hypothetical protein